MILLKFKTEIKGNSQETNHKDWIVIDSWSFSSGRPISFDNDREVGVGHVSDMAFSKTTDIASPNLFIESITGKSLEEATLRIIQTSGSSTGKNEPYVEFTLQNPIICHYSINNGSGDRPTENFLINFTGITYKYKHFVNGNVKAEVEKSFSRITETTV
ncbi:type VI secretion system tube protein Hcp [Pseudomonas batumici]|uniref:Putative cytoplasmic protein USSDB7A n=1 Tax=Pseudomonas batumici TaxID=226910 RepID=A0A0C2EIV9_9PSED|nr:type VI secretion system tube protein Hcp [Pseudomonas batumici]KIH85989.1 putative cytoplasmic protein USSDB7A [Pseudomonas batumici]